MEQLKKERKELAREGEVLKQEVSSLRGKLEDHIVKGLCEIDFFDQITDSNNWQLGCINYFTRSEQISME